MIKFIHAADFHLDAPFTALSPELAKQRREEQREALKDFAKACEGCDMVLLSGDLFDGSTVYLDTVEALKACFASIEASVYIAPGNHDPYREDSPYAREDWGENVHIFTKQELERVELPGCDLYGAAYTEGNWEPLKDFMVEDKGRLNLLLLHTGAQYNPITAEQIAQSGLDYLALGHVHTMQIQKQDYTTCAYPGCLMGRGFDECGRKGFLQVRLSKVCCEPEFIPLEGRRYEILEVEAGADPVEAVLGALPEGAEEHCFRVILRGACEEPVLGAVEAALKERCFSIELIDKTYRKGPRWEGIEEDTLRGEIMKELKHRYDNGSEEDQPRILAAADLLRDLLDGREVSL